MIDPRYDASLAVEINDLKDRTTSIERAFNSSAIPWAYPWGKVAHSRAAGSVASEYCYFTPVAGRAYMINADARFQAPAAHGNAYTVTYISGGGITPFTFWGGVGVVATGTTYSLPIMYRLNPTTTAQVAINIVSSSINFATTTNIASDQVQPYVQWSVTDIGPA